MLHVNHSHIFSITPLLVWVLLTTALQVQVAAHESATQIYPQFESKTTKAINDWRQNAKINPQADEPIRYLGDALMQRARETGNLSDYQEAKSAFQAALAINPKNSAAMAGMAWAHGSLHEFDASIQWALRAIALDPQNPDAYGLLGDAAVERGDYDAAFELYQKMLDIRPDLASYSRGAHLLFVTGDILAATALMEKAIAAGSPFVENIAWCRAELARMHMSTGALVKAEKLIVRGLEVAPDNIHLLVALGRVQTARKEIPAAIATYEKAIAIYPHYDASIALGDLYVRNGEPEKAALLFAQLENIHQMHRTAGIQDDILRARSNADHGTGLSESLEDAQTHANE